MSLKWTGSESGILRKSEFKEKKEELFVFGYSCKLFRDDDKALLIDQGKHLIPWMGDETLKIDRYDARGALHDLSALEAPPGGYDWRVELTKGELDVEQLCDEERYRALHTDEDEEEMYREEELKRLHAAGYGQVGFNYDAPKEPELPVDPVETDEPFVPAPNFQALLPAGTVLPETEKQNVIIEKTAKFIATQGTQMEILIKAKQGDNPQFQFLNKDSALHPYYIAFIALVKAGKWPEKKVEVVEEKPPENEDYLHPSLASTIIESAPSIPSIHYKPSADCDYTMLISKMRGETGPEESYSAELAPGEVAPPGTEPVALRGTAHISRAPVLYGKQNAEPTPQPPITTATLQAQYAQYAAYYQLHAPTTATQPAPAPQPAAPAPQKNPLSSTGLSLMKNYNTDSESDVSDFDDTSSTDSRDKVPIVTPPDDVQVVVDKMALYVSRNGAEFADIVRAKQDPRFSFLEPEHQYHQYYLKVLREKRIGAGQVNGDQKKGKATVSFSIKKLKEPDPVLPKPALPYESSSDEEAEGKEKVDEKKDEPKSNIPPVVINANIPQAVVYKMESSQQNSLPTIKTVETVKILPKASPLPNVVLERPPLVVDKPEVPTAQSDIATEVKNDSRKSPEDKTKDRVEKESIKENEKDRESKEVKRSRDNDREKKHKDRDRDTPRKSKKRYKEKKERSKSDRRSPEREKRDGESRAKKSKKSLKEDLENDIISLEDNDDVMIDLTGDVSDSKASGDAETERLKQAERRRRAAEFLKRVGVDPAAATLPTTSLASAMVDTLESLRKKKKEEEEKRRKREKRRRRDRGYNDADRSHRRSKRPKYRSSDEEDRSDYDSSKKKKHKKEKKSSRSKRRRRRDADAEEAESDVDHTLPPDIDLTSTLKELRNASPSKELGLQDIDESTQQSQNVKQESSSEDDEDSSRRRKKKKEDREYSEGEWSSDTEDDSVESSVKED